MSLKQEPEKRKKRKSNFSRRGFLQGVSITGGVLTTGVLEREADAQTSAKVVGPGEVPITLTINGKPYKTSVEPRVTLCDTLRHRLDLTAAKRVCDRATCGACTVIMDGKVVYSCTVLAIDAQGRQIQTLEGLAQNGKPHPVSQAFTDNDAQQCGYCTPGFVMAAKGFLDKHPNPTYEEVKRGLGGNLCRCGTYVGVRKAVLEAAGKMKGARNA
ncbi:MAG TPA: (2Fe-2S)-binding protein [Bryobacteraceae bacterium]|nr:(2Fe-2S)-binding protein [Bryobacteraceae bacterium]